MRATRAYLAGLGTAGALVLGAALLFVVATAIVAFHGWPGVSGAGRPSRQLVAVAAPSDAVARRVEHVTHGADAATVPRPVRTRTAATGRRRVSGSAHPGVPHRIAPTRRIVAASAPVPVGVAPPARPVTGRRPTAPTHRAPTSTTSTTSTPAPVAASPAGASGGATVASGAARPAPVTTTPSTPTVPTAPVVSPAAPAPPTDPVTVVTGTLGTTLGTAGTTLGHVGTGLGTTVGGIGSGTPLAPVTHGVGGAVGGLGGAVGGTVSGLGRLLG